MARYFIETIEEPKRYWLESHAVRGWFPDRGAASYFGEHDRKCMPLPVGGLWVIVDEPKPVQHHFTTIKLRPVVLTLSAIEADYDELNSQVNEFEAALRQWVKKQQILNGSEWDIDFECEE
jgi:hypothetical protein